MREETRCRHMGYSFRLTAWVLLYAPSHRQDSTYHGLCYTSREALAGTWNSSMGSPDEGSIRRPIEPWANDLTTELHLAPQYDMILMILVITGYVKQREGKPGSRQKYTYCGTRDFQLAHEQACNQSYSIIFLSLFLRGRLSLKAIYYIFSQV